MNMLEEIEKNIDATKKVRKKLIEREYWYIQNDALMQFVIEMQSFNNQQTILEALKEIMIK